MSDHSEDPDRFLGMTKDTFIILGFCAAMVLVALSLGVLAYSISVNRTALGKLQQQDSEIRANTARIEAVAIETHLGVCGIKNNTQKQIESTADYLATHTGAEPIPGISRESLIQSLQRQRAFRDSFKSVDCTDFHAPPGP